MTSTKPTWASAVPGPSVEAAQVVSASKIESSPIESVVDALESMLIEGFDPENDALRSRVETPTGELLLMPSAFRGFGGVKLLSNTPGNGTRGLPVIQGAYLLFEGPEQRVAAILDGIALTNLRTPAVSALAIRHLAIGAGSEVLTIFGSGPQARAHALALRDARPIAEIHLVGTDPPSLKSLAEEVSTHGTPVHIHGADDASEAVAVADIICTCTSSPTPVFDGARVKDTTVVVAVGSHSPDTRETDNSLVQRAQVIIESRASVLNEAGDILIPLKQSLIHSAELATLSDIVTGDVHVDLTRPRLFKFTGMPWQDLAAAVEARG